MRAPWWLAMGAVLGCGDAVVVTPPPGAGCSWGECAAPRPRCVMTGIADGSWLTADVDEWTAPGCASIPRALELPSTPGRYMAGPAPIGEVRCEGLRPGAATVRVHARVRLLTTDALLDGSCDCPRDWNVALRVSIDGREAQTLSGPAGGGANDPGCRAGPDIDEGVSATVGEDGLLRVRVELETCARPYPGGECVFLRGTSVEVVQ